MQYGDLVETGSLGEEIMTLVKGYENRLTMSIEVRWRASKTRSREDASTSELKRLACSSGEHLQRGRDGQG